MWCTNNGVRQDGHRLSLENDVDIYYIIKLVEFILLVILAPIFCFIGIIHNILIILVISNKTMKNHFQASMYKHILINSRFP